MSVSRITLEKNKMTYIYDHSKGTIISDEKPELKDKKTRKPGAVPPKTNTVKMDSIPIPKFDPNLYNRAIEINNERPEQPINVPAPNLPFEETAEAKGTIFGTDAYYRRKRGL